MFYGGKHPNEVAPRAVWNLSELRLRDEFRRTGCLGAHNTQWIVWLKMMDPWLCAEGSISLARNQHGFGFYQGKPQDSPKRLNLDMVVPRGISAGLYPGGWSYNHWWSITIDTEEFPISWWDAQNPYVYVHTHMCILIYTYIICMYIYIYIYTSFVSYNLAIPLMIAP